MNVSETQEVLMTAARKFAAGLAEIASLGVFLGMIWLWAAILSGPHV
jgi:fructoselysine-6-P-deglycase FrlB-like protein